MEKNLEFLVRGKDIRLREEFNHLYREYERTGEKRLREELITSNVPLIHYVLNKHARYCLMVGRDLMVYEDWISEGEVGLVKAFDSYNLERGSSFPTYATKCIFKELHYRFEYLSREKRRKSIFSLDLAESIKGDKENNVKNLLVPEIDGSDPIDKIVNEDFLRWLVGEANLTEREIDILNRRYGLNGYVEVLKEIAVDYGLSRERINQIQKKALRKLKDVYDGFIDRSVGNSFFGEAGKSL